MAIDLQDIRGEALNCSDRAGAVTGRAMRRSRRLKLHDVDAAAQGLGERRSRI
jgi:hypothetical protein